MAMDYVMWVDQSSSFYITVFEMHVIVAHQVLTQQTVRDNEITLCWFRIYSFFPDRLTPAFVACSSNAVASFPGPAQLFHRFQYCKWRKDGRGLGTRLLHHVIPYWKWWKDGRGPGMRLVLQHWGWKVYQAASLPVLCAFVDEHTN